MANSDQKKQEEGVVVLEDGGDPEGPPQEKEEDEVYSTFSKSEKWAIIAMASMASFCSPISSQIYFPAMPILIEHYNMTTTLINLTVTTYMIIQGLAPSILGNFADMGGRRPAYILSFTIYTAANIGLAVQDSYPALMVLRCLQSAGSSATIPLGYGVAADIASPAERGTYIGPMTAGTMAALSLGPVIGGVLVQFLGWRSIFWFLTIFSGSYLAVYMVVMPETSRRLMGNGSTTITTWWRLPVIQYVSARRRAKKSTDNQSTQHGTEQSRKLSFPNPLPSLFILGDKAAFINIWQYGVVYGSMIGLMTSTANSFGDLYGLDSFGIGLCFLPFGITGCFGSVIGGRLVDFNLERITGGIPKDRQRNDDSQLLPFERARLQIVFPVLSVAGATFISYGWAVQYKVPLAVPLALQGILGFFCTAVINTLNTLLIDLFPEKPATVHAASNLVRCWIGAILAAVIDYMLRDMGWGWCFTFLGLVILAAMPLLGIEYLYGMKWREAKRENKADQNAE